MDPRGQAIGGPLHDQQRPDGYGKSTLLRQWAANDSRPSAWLRLDKDDNYPVLLLAHLAGVLDQIAPIGPAVFQWLAVPNPRVLGPGDTDGARPRRQARSVR
jgi:LuxR family maltose regulon positive regulatory protein